MLVLEPIAKTRRLSLVQGNVSTSRCHGGCMARELERLLATNVAKPARERLALIRIFEHRDLG